MKKFLLCAALLLTASRATAGFVLPNGLQPGDTFRVVFVTTTRIGAFSSDITYYDGVVTTDAIDAGLGTFNGHTVTWEAIASTATTSANSRLLPDSVPIYLPDGTVVAPGVSSAFWSGAALINPINETLTGWKPDTDVWTGTAPDGSSSPNPLGFPSPTIGNSSVTTGPPLNWLSWTQSPAGDGLPLYGVSSTLTVPQATPEPSSLLLMASGGPGLLGWVWLRRQRVHAANATFG